MHLAAQVAARHAVLRQRSRRTPRGVGCERPDFVSLSRRATKSRWRGRHSELHLRLSILGSRRLAVCKLWQLLTLHHREAQPLVRIEDYHAREDIWAEERLELALSCHVHPHPLERGTAAVKLGGELRLHSREHVHISCRCGSVRQINDTKSLSLEADISLRVLRQLRYVLDQPWPSFLSRTLLSAARRRNLVSHTGLAVQIHPCVNRAEVHVALVLLADLGLRPTDHEESRELLNLELLHNRILGLLDESELN